MKKTAALVICSLLLIGCSRPVWAAEIAEPGKPLEGTLTISTFYAEQQTKSMIDLFRAENPGVEVVVNAVFDRYPASTEDYREGMNIFATQLASGETADLYDTTYLSAAKFVNSGYFEDLYDYMEADESFHKEDYFEKVFEACESNGALYQIPQAFYFSMIRLNKNITEQLDYEIPDTMDYRDVYQLFSMAREKGFVNSEFTIDRNDMSLGYLQMAEDRLYVRPDLKEVSFDSQEFVECLRMLSEMSQYKPQIPQNDMSDIRDFSGTDCLMNAFPSWIDNSPQNLFDETETGSAPVLLTASDGKVPFYRLGAYWSIGAGAKEKALAWEFIKFCIGQRDFEFSDVSSPDYDRNFFSYAAMINRNNTMQLAEHYLGENEAAVQKWNEYNNCVNAKFFTEMQLGSMMSEYYQQCFDGTVTPEECAEVLQQRVSIYMNE